MRNRKTSRSRCVNVNHDIENVEQTPQLIAAGDPYIGIRVVALSDCAAASNRRSVSPWTVQYVSLRAMKAKPTSATLSVSLRNRWLSGLSKNSRLGTGTTRVAATDWRNTGNITLPVL